MNLVSSTMLFIIYENITSGIPFHFAISQTEGQFSVSTVNLQL